MNKAGWQRSRSPEDVPTPVAVAVADFCRRAGAPASPVEVREALSVLADDEDFRVRALTDGEPSASPLGPWAVVDVLRGTAQALAATRQSCGFYELARALVEAESAPAPATDAIPASPTATPPAAPLPPVPAAPPLLPDRTRRERAPLTTIAERIAPRRRPADKVAAERPPLPALEPEHLAGRDGVLPKGRFAQLSPQRQSVDELFRPELAKVLEARIDQYPDRFALTRALGAQYSGRREGQPLRTEDVERALRHHGILDKLAHKEREAILGSYTEQRGATNRVAFALGLTVPELNRLVSSLGIAEQIEEIRERFRREALSPKNLSARLDLLGRGKYLADLGIRTRFDDALREDLAQLFRRLAPGASDVRELMEIAGRHQGAQAELISRAVEKLGLSNELRKLFPDEPTHPTHFAT
ncbi:MAG TPA: hypothetical protein VE782_12170 [Myxococcaceae bacterium]|nr:hypothetical protein [Myxococcaceae bacterium]